MKDEARALLGRVQWEETRGKYQSYRVKAGGERGGELIVALCGVGIDRAAAGAGFLLGEGAEALVGAGISGALSSDLKAGDLVLAGKVMDEDGALYEASERAVNDALKILEAASFNVREGLIISTKMPLLNSVSKKKIYKKTGALAVDMESVGLAAAAAKKGLPFFIMRAVSDGADAAIAPDLYACLDEESGEIRPARVIGSSIRRPALVRELMSLRAPYNLALSTMRRAWQTLLGAGFLSSI